jgi:hypothetical protein
VVGLLIEVKDLSRSTLSILGLGSSHVPIMGLNWPGHETDHSPPSRAYVKNVWSYTSTT